MASEKDCGKWCKRVEAPCLRSVCQDTPVLQIHLCSLESWAAFSLDMTTGNPDGKRAFQSSPQWLSLSLCVGLLICIASYSHLHFTPAAATIVQLPAAQIWQCLPSAAPQAYCFLPWDSSDIQVREMAVETHSHMQLGSVKRREGGKASQANLIHGHGVEEKCLPSVPQVDDAEVCCIQCLRSSGDTELQSPTALTNWIARLSLGCLSCFIVHSVSLPFWGGYLSIKCNPLSETLPGSGNLRVKVEREFWLKNPCLTSKSYWTLGLHPGAK